MTIRVCSGFNPAGYDLYGKQFLETFARHWPKAVELVCYVEDAVKAPRGQMRPLWQIAGVTGFLDRHAKNPEANGREPSDKWKDSERRVGYSYRWDARKFCRQLFIPEHAARGLAVDDVLVWLDADVLTFADIPRGFVEGLLGDAEVCYLGRGKKHSEIGFWAVRINARTKAFLTDLADTYRTDDVFKLREWHSAYVFDYVRQRHGLIERDLSPNGKGHVWFTTPLGKYTDHLKGARKKAGRSPERR